MHIALGILMLLFPIPLYFFFRWLFSNRRATKEITAVENAYRRMIGRHGLSIEEVHEFTNRLIAIDRQKGALVLVIHNDGITREKYISLHDVGTCHIVKTTDHPSGYIEQVNIEVGLRNTPEKITFPFFDEQTDDIRELAHRIKLSRYWERKIAYSSAMFNAPEGR